MSMRQCLRLFASILVIMLTLPNVLCGPSGEADEAGPLQLGDPADLKPFAEFHSIGTLVPGSNAVTMRVTNVEINEWRLIEPELKRIGDQQGNPRAADARLLLACGKWLFEKDTDQAVQIAKSVAERYPSAPTIFTINPYDRMCPLRLDGRWFPYFRELQTGKKPTTARTDYEQERDRFVSHMVKYPARVADIARLFVYSVSEENNKSDNGLRLLEEVLQDARTKEIQQNREADRQAGIHADYPVSAVFMRPEAVAALFFIDHCSATKNKEKLSSRGVEVVQLVSPDGWYWTLNQRLGDALLELEPEQNRSVAENQYRLALAGFLEHTKHQPARFKGRKPFPNLENFQKTDLDLKKRIQKAGGKIALDTKDVDEILARAAEPEKTPQGMDMIRKRMKDVHGRKGDLASAAGRKAVAEQIAQSAKKEKLTTDEVAEVAVVFSYMASEETDADMRRLMLAKMSETVPIAPATESSRDIAPEDREKADRYIKQLCGESVEGGVPHPNSNLADMSVPALLYAAERIERGDLALKARQDITRALVSSENPALYKFFADMVQRAEDKKLTRIAINGLTRIIQNRQSGKR